MKKPTFLQYTKPLICAMITEDTVDKCQSVIANSIADGAEAIGIQLDKLKLDERSEDKLRRLFSFCKGLPIYVTSYRTANSVGLTDDECADLLLLAAKCGATLCDIMNDFYDKQPYEFTQNEVAIEKQKELAKKLHDMGVEVLFSCHTHTSFDKETILAVAKQQAEKGADVIKIVNFANNKHEFLENIDACVSISEVTDKKYLFLTSGSYSGRFLRYVGPSLGVCMYLCVESYKDGSSYDQPKITAIKQVRDGITL